LYNEAKEASMEYASTEIEVENMRERFLYLVSIFTADRNRYALLQQHTGIPAGRWQNVMLEKQLPSCEMLISVCHALPQYTNWLMHGKQNETPQHEYPTEENWQLFKGHRQWTKTKKGLA